MTQLRRSLVIAALFLAFGAADALATHFRYGTIRWQSTAAGGNVIQFTVNTAWRRSFFGTPGIGSTINPGTFCFGDGTCVNMVSTVTAVNVAEDWVEAVFTTTKTYAASNATYTAQHTNCCRISSLTNGNNDVTWTIRSTVTVNMANPNSSPASGMLPIVSVPAGLNASFPIIASDPNGDALTYSIAPTSESSLSVAAPANLSVHPTTGIVSWTPAGVNGTMHAVQFKVTDSRGASIPIDIIIRPLTLVGQLPTMLINGLSTAQTINATIGQPMSFTFSGTDPDINPSSGLPNRLVTITAVGVPIGAATTPTVPFNAPSPATGTFSWTPGALGTFNVSFAATDDTFAQDTNTATIIVSQQQAPTTTTLPDASGVVGSPILLSATVTSGSGVPVGQVQFFVNGAFAGQAALSGGVANFNYVPAAQGTFPIEAKYLGATVGTIAYVASQGTGTLTVTPALTAMTITAIPNPSVPGESVAFTATLTRTSPPTDPVAGVPVTFTAGALTFPPVTTIAGGIAVLNTSALPVGTHLVTAAFAGNSTLGSSTASVSHVVKDVDPPVVIVDDVTVEATGALTPVTFAASANDLVDGAVATTCDYPSPASLPVGSVVVTCTATDAAGNTGTDTATLTVKDTIAPTVTVDDVTVEATGPMTDVAFASSATDLVDGVLAPTCTYSSPASLSVGSVVVSCSATDAAGNTGTDTATLTVTDTTAPTVTVDDVTVEATGPMTDVAFASSATDLADGVLTPTCTYSSPASLSVGSVVVSCSATDAAGNTGTDTATLTVKDTTAPTVTVDDVTVEATGPMTDVAFASSANDLVDGGLTATCTLSSPVSLSVGSVVVSCSATDAAGNTGTDTATLTVKDTTAPSVTVDDVAVEATGPITDVAFGSSATDLVDGGLTPNCTYSSPASLSVGSVVVSCSATDAAGNTGTDTATLTVADTTPPDLTLPENITVHASSPAGAFVTYSTNSVDLVSGVLPVVCSTPSGTFALGETTVTCSSSDAAGNTSSGSFLVTVTNVAPVCSATPSISTIWQPNHLMVPIGLSATDADGDTVSINVTGIFQDEPTNAEADGNTNVDAAGVGTANPEVRAERAGTRNGRVYHIFFTATDQVGATCSAEVKVGVPHDQGGKSTLIDDGALFNSVTGLPQP